MIHTSPFLHRGESKPRHRYQSDAARVRLDEDKAKSKLTLERLRYRQYEKAGRLFGWFKPLSDFFGLRGWRLWDA